MPVRPCAQAVVSSPPLRNLAFSASDARWGHLLQEPASRERVQRCLDLFAQRLEIPEDFEKEVTVLLAAIAEGRDGDGSEGIVTPIQAMRALNALAHGLGPKLPAFRALLGACHSDDERAVLLKGLGARANRSRDPATETELKELADLIRGKSFGWLRANTIIHGTGLRLGLRQVYSHSCAPTIRLAAEAEMDPLLAIRLLAGSDPNQPDGLAGRIQKEQLTRAGGVAVPAMSAGGRGTRDDALVFDTYEGMGARMTAVSQNDFTPALQQRIADTLFLGVDVPIRVATRDNEGHSLLAVDLAKLGSAVGFRIHDPADGMIEGFDPSILFREFETRSDPNPVRVMQVYLPELDEGPQP